MLGHAQLGVLLREGTIDHLMLSGDTLLLAGQAKVNALLGNKTLLAYAIDLSLHTV